LQAVVTNTRRKLSQRVIGGLAHIFRQYPVCEPAQISGTANANPRLPTLAR
jgi:hypothetical protein